MKKGRINEEGLEAKPLRKMFDISALVCIQERSQVKFRANEGEIP